MGVLGNLYISTSLSVTWEEITTVHKQEGYFHVKLSHCKSEYVKEMKERIIFRWVVTVLLSLVSAKQSSGSFFSSLQFTRDALMGFSRGCQQTVVINVASKNTTKMVNKTFKMTGRELGSIFAFSRVRSLILPEERHGLFRGMSAGSFSRTAAGNRA